MLAQPELVGIVTGGVGVSDLQLEEAVAPSASPAAAAPVTTSTDPNMTLIVLLGVLAGAVVVAAIAVAVSRCRRVRQGGDFQADMANPGEVASKNEHPASRVAEWT